MGSQPKPLHVVSAIMFSPRGGSSHVARAVADCLRGHGLSVTLVSGSRTDSDPAADALEFYGDVQAVDFAPALAERDPLTFQGPPGTAPMHPSFEDRPGAPDAVFARLDDTVFERQVDAWARELARAGAAEADVLYLHHLTPVNEAAARVAPEVPVVGHLHGTELLMLEQIASGPPPGWRYAERWAERMREWAHRCSRLVVVPAGRDRAVELLGVPEDRLVTLPGGVDVKTFAPRQVDRRALWRRVLIEEPRGWLPGQHPGSVRYGEADVRRLGEGVVFLYVGRFTEVKRIDVLVEAFGLAGRRASEPISLVLVGGHPGEWEGTHPAELVDRVGAEGVFLAGWYPHSVLPEFLSAGDAVVLASDREQFGQVLIEAMACGRPAIATASLGPATIIEDGSTGWLVPIGDAAALADAMVEAADAPAECERRGRMARGEVCERFSWDAVTGRLAQLLDDVVNTRMASEDEPRLPA
ncbi:MAG TPA: glycosyltransferase family 4 protein [Solirubrobacteraceae bacterium]|nr:glycosyltransferase family 4 protein [Solirubrobacteraceae bacterium]